MLLVDGHASGGRPIRVTIMVTAVRGIVAMTIFLKFTCYAIVGYSNRMKSMHPAVASHVAGLDHLLTLAFSRAAAAAPAIGVAILVGRLRILGKEGDCVG